MGGGVSRVGNVFLSIVLGNIFYNHGSAKLPVPVRTCTVVLYTGIAFESRPLKQLLHKGRMQQTGSKTIVCRSILYVWGIIFSSSFFSQQTLVHGGVAPRQNSDWKLWQPLAFDAPLPFAYGRPL